MNKKFLTKTFASAMVLRLLLSNGLMLGLERAEAKVRKEDPSKNGNGNGNDEL